MAQRIAPILATGQSFGHYRIAGKVGEGGMGEVYRAHDQQLDRDVALKVLPTISFSDATAKARLLREARAAAALNHPHICTIHEVGEAEGQMYIAMELVEGETLSARLAAGPLPAEQVVRYGLQLAEALGHAHEHGVVHRDLKSANVVITAEGQVKVLDFGLAKRASKEDLDEATRSQLSLTAPGAMPGTLAYMAPEQLCGLAADARSDVWALGVVLCEMSSGARPFQGRTGSELASSILNQRPALPGRLPLDLSAVIARCLEKEPGRRYQRASEVGAALEAIQQGTVRPWAGWRYPAVRRRRWLAVAATAAAMVLGVVGALDIGGLRTRLSGGAPRIQSLAVLPLENLSGDAGQDYFADGMTEALITDLGRLGGLKRVIARGSVMRYKGSKRPLSEIGQELKVDVLITGAVLRSGNRVRITVQLISPANEQQVWASGFDRDLRDVLELQSEMSRAIADEIRVKLTPDEKTRLASARQVIPEAYDAYLKGMHLWYKLTPQDLDAALQYFELALKKDPNSALAYSGIAAVWGGRSQMGFAPPSEASPKAKAAALKALELDNGLAEAHLWLGAIKCWYEWDFAGAGPEFQRAIDLNPNYPDARAIRSHYLMIMGHPEEAMAEIQRALELDPFNSLFQNFYGVDLHFVRREDEAIAQFRMALKTAPDSPMAYPGLWGAYDRKQMHREALEALEAYAKGVGYAELEAALAARDPKLGYRETMRLAGDALAARSRKIFTAPTDVATCYIQAGERDLALEWLEKGFEARDPNMPYIVTPDFDSVKDDPRYRDLLRRMNLRQ